MISRRRLDISPRSLLCFCLFFVEFHKLSLFIFVHADVREVGNFLPGPPKPLPVELEEFYQGSGDDGVIFVSFGSMVDTLHDDIIEVMNTAFSKVPQKVLWRINLGEYCCCKVNGAYPWKPQNGSSIFSSFDINWNMTIL
jgi:hypothetical protein